DTVSVNMSLEIPGLATRSGSRLFLRPNLMEQWTSVPPAVENRTQPVVFAYAFVREDSIVYRLPDRFEVEALPRAVDRVTSFGRYRSRVVLDENEGTLTYTRLLRIDNAEIPAESYDEVIEFFAGVAKADGRQAVLKRAS
ncbi:MAG: hypothetical protein R3282_09935, partial [Rhodothermales bacterium]|nr:hypothetical protein [Rhodothermales bacterium]